LDKDDVALNKKYETDLQKRPVEVDDKIQANKALASLPEANQLVNAAKRVWFLNNSILTF
jgi:hypothetical protein